ncbi:M24/M37 family peptidase [Alcanivorax hongdengensis A-11-3]|uniref:M24/M37 family peptidase n=1 Tax=Alcanivorax hongdengensis A-11-3 TaxID=1177179 RepID=L0WEQ5_9GAMM|nr:peptidoglycan DD-metalloendopeptidase family protein [Alcanivorax hongdengensis]EKF75318.1 M24/M37 family peptidase [Alcanivorax hongdengensis A-11-3]
MKELFSAAARLVRQFPRTHLLISMVLLGVVILIAMRPSGSEPEQTIKSTPLAAAPARPDSQTAAKPAPKPKPQPQWQSLTVAAGDTLSSLLQPEGVGAGQVYRLLGSDERLQALTRIRPGETIDVIIDDQDTLQGVQYHPSRLETLTARLDGDSWQTRVAKREYQHQTRYAEAEISDSLFLAAAASGISNNLTMKLANLFAWDIDFVLDIRKGDHFRIIYDELYLDGEKVGDGDILMAELWNRDRHLVAYRYINRAGDEQYLDPDGNSMRKAFIRTPVAFTRISSRFSTGRLHPILGRTRPHEGVDYAAPTGTPIKAAGDGKIIFAGRKGGYGNCIIIKHGRVYSTLYGHMHGFARGMRVGSRVKQGQTIGYVGMSGLATGPHLHYEFRINGVHHDPLTVKLPKAQGIAKDERSDFLADAGRLKAQMALFAEASTLASSDLLRHDQ